jgi:hypothetical protein
MQRISSVAKIATESQQQPHALVEAFLYGLNIQFQRKESGLIGLNTPEDGWFFFLDVRR